MHGEHESQGVAAGLTAQGTVANAETFDKIIVAIHGIGSQQRSDTIRAVARAFGTRRDPKAPVRPLGYFHSPSADQVRVTRIVAKSETDDPLYKIGFVEVFWADIPRAIVREGDTLEEIKAWGKSVVSRSYAQYRKHVQKKGLTDPKNKTVLDEADFDLAAEVIEEIVDTINVAENLLLVLDKMGIFKFKLRDLLLDYLGDVQVVAEFEDLRRQIVGRFHGVMTQIVANHCSGTHEPEIYVVAHSEGTVVSLLALLEALSESDVRDPTKSRLAWVRFVRGFMTLGSPIDKHLHLWPELWNDFELRCDARDGKVAFPVDRLHLSRPIEWRNYYDYGDPVGFELDSARAFLRERGCHAFNFEEEHDHGFSRYYLPGAAHNEYWTDPGVFEHFIDDVVMPPATPEATGARPGEEATEKPGNKPLAGTVSKLLPYLASLALHVAAIYFLFKGVTDYTVPSARSWIDSIGHALRTVLPLGFLLMSITVAARVPRLVKTRGLRWHVTAAAILTLGAVITLAFLSTDTAAVLGEGTAPWLTSIVVFNSDVAYGVTTLIAAAVSTAIIGWVAARKSRWVRLVLVGVGTVATVALTVLVCQRLVQKTDAPLWPMVLAVAAFLYSWWLGILVFDLALVWHRYIRTPVCARALKAWREGRDLEPASARDAIKMILN
jgi:hypothetical protein